MTRASMLRSTWTLAAAFVLLWNSGFIGAEYGLPYAPPFTFLFWRYAALSVLLAVWLLARGELRWPGGRAAGRTALIGVLAHGAWLACVLLALDREVPAGIVALVVALQPLATGALSGPLTGESTSPRQWLGLVLGFVGVAVAVGGRLEWDTAASWIAHLLPFGSVAAITVATLIRRRAELGASEPPPAVSLDLFYQSVATTLALALPAILVEGLATRWDPRFVAALAWLVLAVSHGAYGLMWALLARLDATRVASLFYLGPPVTMLMAWIAFGDTVAPLDLVGLALVAGGVATVERSEDGEP